MPTLMETRDSLKKQAREALAKAKAGDQDAANAASKLAEDLKGVTEQINQVKASEDLINSLGGGKGVKHAGGKTLGEHAVAFFKKGLADFKGVPGATVSAPEWKAANDPHLTGGTDGTFGPALTQVDTSIVSTVPRLTVMDLFTQGTLDQQAITYFVETARDGDFKAVAEGAAKPQLKYNYEKHTDGLSKIAGWIRESDEVLEDLKFLASEINNRLLADLALAEEAQVLAGDGSGANLKGVLNRSGIQTETAKSNDELADALYKATTKIQNGANLQADGIVMNPADYETLRLAKDQNHQYYGGGYFDGAYGNANNVVLFPPVWGIPTVVTPHVPKGTALVGAFKTAAALYHKGGIRTAMTNSHGEDFTSNMVVLRAEKRVALAVRRPAGFVKVTVSPSVGG